MPILLASLPVGPFKRELLDHSNSFLFIEDSSKRAIPLNFFRCGIGGGYHGDVYLLHEYISGL